MSWLDWQWDNRHADDCPVTKWRARLLDDLERDPDNRYRRGAVPEYDHGGDQEVELCTCSTVPMLDAGWTYHPTYGWHRGTRCAGDRYWDDDEALAIFRAEGAAGRTLWPGDGAWPAEVGR